MNAYPEVEPPQYIVESFKFRKDSGRAGFRAQFDIASDLYNQAAGPFNKADWQKDLENTLSSELNEAYKLNDIRK